MTHKLKGLGLALFAMLALGAFSASAASADEPAALTLDESPVTITGEDEVTGELTRDERRITCEKANYHGVASNLDTGMSLVPTYEECDTGVAGSIATIHMNGCYYDFEFTGELVGEDHTYTATTDLICDHENHVIVEVWLSKHNKETGAGPNCVYTFSDTHVHNEQNVTVNQNLEGIDLTNIPAGGETAKNWITADITVEGIDSTRTTGTTLICGVQHDTEGVLHAKVKLKAENEDDEEVGATISTHTE